MLSNPLTFVDILELGPAEGDTGGGPDEGGSSSSFSCSSCSAQQVQDGDKWKQYGTVAWKTVV